jgi:hypothetical protein
MKKETERQMVATTLPVMLETGPKGKRVVAVAADWPGLERGGKTDEAAMETLLSYIPRYLPVAQLAGLGDQFAAFSEQAGGEVVERYEGVGSTDFWGISFGFSSRDTQAISAEELERQLSLMRACWQYFDEVRARVSPEMRKGPRGGGRDRDRIALHVLFTEQDWGKKLGLDQPAQPLTKGEALTAWRDAYCAAIRAFHKEEKTARKWPLAYLIRHTAYHAMDHSWEMEDKDLSATA